MPVEGVNVVVPEAKKFELLPVDVYHTQLLDIELTEDTKYQSDEKEQKLVFTFVVIQDGEFYGRRMWQRATLKLSKFKGGSNLYKILVGLNNGVQLTDEQCSPEGLAAVCGDAALNSLINKQVRLSISQKAKEDKTLKNVIDSYLPAKEELPVYDSEKVQLGESQPAAAGATDDIDFDA